MAEMSQLDILVHASIIAEPFGQVILEGMAAGLPVIASCGGGVSEIITHGENGWLTPMGDPDALAEGIIALLREPTIAQRLGKSAFQHVRQRFRAASAARKVEEIYQCFAPTILNRSI
jgi:glycosyltransferase involved in cell wall biosynthesis